MSAIAIPKDVAELMAAWHPNAVARAMTVALHKDLTKGKKP